MSTNFTKLLKRSVFQMIKNDLKYRSEKDIIEDLYTYAKTLMTDEEKFIYELVKNRNIRCFDMLCYPCISAEKYLGRYFLGYYLILPIRLFEHDEFKKYLDNIRLKADEYLQLIKDIDESISCCRGFREFNQTLPQFSKYLERARKEMYGDKKTSKNLPMKPIEFKNLDKFLKVEEVKDEKDS